MAPVASSLFDATPITGWEVYSMVVLSIGLVAIIVLSVFLCECCSGSKEQPVPEVLTDYPEKTTIASNKISTANTAVQGNNPTNSADGPISTTSNGEGTAPTATSTPRAIRFSVTPVPETLDNATPLGLESLKNGEKKSVIGGGVNASKSPAGAMPSLTLTTMPKSKSSPYMMAGGGGGTLSISRTVTTTTINSINSVKSSTSKTNEQSASEDEASSGEADDDKHKKVEPKKKLNRGG